MAHRVNLQENTVSRVCVKGTSEGGVCTVCTIQIKDNTCPCAEERLLLSVETFTRADSAKHPSESLNSFLSIEILFFQTIAVKCRLFPMNSVSRSLFSC